jgi:hypothetical protein
VWISIFGSYRQSSSEKSRFPPYPSALRGNALVPRLVVGHHVEIGLNHDYVSAGHTEVLQNPVLWRDDDHFHLYFAAEFPYLNLCSKFLINHIRLNAASIAYI